MTMTLSPILVFHMCAATVALFSGAVALFSRKGARLHRVAGSVFFVSMLIMTASAAYMASMKVQRINAVVGVLTFYMVATAWMAVKRKDGAIGLFDYVALIVVLADGTASVSFGFQAQSGAIVLNDGPAAGCFVFGGLALFAAALDVRVLSRGGVYGAQRIARHLWRMCYALLITAISAFVGKQQLFTAISLLLGKHQVFPEAIRKSDLVYVPIIVVAVTMIFWLIRVHFTNAYKKTRKQAGPAGPAAPVSGYPARTGTAG